MNQIHSFIIFFTLIILGCRSTTTAIKRINPNSIKGLTTKLNKVDASSFNFNNTKVTIGGLYISKNQITVNEYFLFIRDISKNIDKNKLKDSLSYYIDINNSSIKLINNQLVMNSDHKDATMTYVSYYGALEYCDWVSKRYCGSIGMPKFRLPSEYEWIGALEQDKIRPSQKLSISDWVEESNCIETYQPFVRKACVVDWFSPYPSLMPDSSIVKSIVDKKQKQHDSYGYNKVKVDSTIGFRIAQT